ncbi:hypothetical protein, partial [Shewanella marina]|uniref:hypothetical protein n=1 Tax=Shewanella marina TaxID=487319 RepID=UPI001F2A53AB
MASLLRFVHFFKSENKKSAFMPFGYGNGQLRDKLSAFNSSTKLGFHTTTAMDGGSVDYEWNNHRPITWIV